MEKQSTIITLVAFVLAGLFALLENAWVGFKYFVLSVLLLLSIYWGVINIIKYFTSFKAELEEEYGVFRARKITELRITSEDYEKNEEQYRQLFKKSQIKEKFLKWCVILICFGIAFAFLMAIILM